MSGPGEEMAAAEGRSHGDLRVSHADGEQVIGVLKAAFVQGVLAKDDFDRRVGQALASRTYAELTVLTADLFTRPTAAQSSLPAQAQGDARIPRPGLVIIAVTVVYAAVWALAFALPRGGGQDHDPHVGLALVATFFYLFFLPRAGAQMVSEWLDKHSGGQLPRRPAPGTGGQAVRRRPSAGPGGELPPAIGGQQRTAEAARSRLPRQQSPGSCPPRRWRYRGRGHTIGYAGD